MIAYPIFRLTVSMAAGIFLFDQFLTGEAALLLKVSLAALVLCVLGMGWMYHVGIYRWRMLFGLLTTCFCMVFGGARVLQEHLRVDYNWQKGGGVYWGEVMTLPVAKGKSMQAEVRVIQGCADSIPPSGRVAAGVPIERTVLLYWMPDSLQRAVKCGDKLLFSTTISRPLSDAEVTGFDYASYLFRKGISGTGMAFAGDWRVFDRKESLDIRQLALSCRNKIVDRYREWRLGDNEFAVVAALTIGDKSVLPDSIKEIYSAAGVSHVLALSGLHIGILSAILFFFLSPLKRVRYGETLRSLLVVLALWIFAFVSGLSPSVVRAVTMCTLYFLSTCVSEEKFAGVYSLLLAAFIMLIYQPFYLFDLSFQLSFLAVASILYFYPLISGCVEWKNKLLRWVWNGLSVSIAAQLGTLPLILYYFGTFPTYFLLANLIVSVLAVCVLCGALVALAVWPVPYLGALAIGFLNYVTLGLNTSIRWVQQLDGSQVGSLSISLTQALCGFILLYGLYQFAIHKKPRYTYYMLIALNLIIAEWALRPLRPTNTMLCFSSSHLYLKQHDTVRELTSANGLYTIDTLRIGVFTDDRWSKKQSLKPIPLNYLYLTRGFKGNMKSLVRVFTINHLLLDATLSERYRKYLKHECEELKIPYTDNSEKGSFRILL